MGLAAPMSPAMKRTIELYFQAPASCSTGTTLGMGTPRAEAAPGIPSSWEQLPGTPVEGGCEVGIGGAEDEFACPGVNDVPQGGTEL